MSFASPPARMPSPPISFGLGEPTQHYPWAGVAFFAVLVFYTALWKGPYDTIPAIGGTDFVSSYLSAINFSKNAKEWVQIGYNKHKSGVFRIPQMNRWLVVVSGEKLTDELRKAPDDTLDGLSAVEETLLNRHLVGRNILANRYHVGLVRARLTRNIGNLFPAMRDEMARAFEDNIPPGDGKSLSTAWTKVTAYAAVLQIVTRTLNRIFVGVPLCRDPGYIGLNIRHTLYVAKGSHILTMFPNFLKPLAANLLTNVPRSIRLGLTYLKPLIEERQKNIDEYGHDYPDKPNDFLSWLLDEAEGEERTPQNLTNRILHLNFAAIHTSSMSFTQALFHLAARPEYVDPLRNEVDAVIAEEGWSKVAMTRMRKLDSFLKETQRFDGLTVLAITRKALKDFTFSNGTHIPKGAMVSSAARARHHDDEIYTDSEKFDGFRFSDIRDQDGEEIENQFVATSTDYLPFGHGRHACPGRFFAANELKAMMAHILLTYDVKMVNEGVRPPTRWIGLRSTPDTKTEVFFRRRQT